MRVSGLEGDGCRSVGEWMGVRTRIHHSVFGRPQLSVMTDGDGINLSVRTSSVITLVIATLYNTTLLIITLNYMEWSVF